MGFRGNAPAKTDAQGRIKLPSAHKKVLDEEFGPELFVTSKNGSTVLIYPLAEWEKIEEKLAEPPRMMPEKIKFLRNTNYWGQVTSVDKHGRLVIQAHLREAATIKGEVAVIGNRDHLEVWNQERITEQMNAQPYTDKDDEALADKLGI